LDLGCVIDHLGVSPSEQPQPSYEELAGLVVELTSQLERAHARIAELEARLGRDSTNSSQPPSQDSITAKARRRANRSSQERSKDRRLGGQPGHAGSGLALRTEPDRRETVSAPTECSGCGEGLGKAADEGLGWARVWALPPIALEKVHYLLPRRCCGKTTTAAAPFGAPGTVAYGANVKRRGNPAGHRGHCARQADRDADGRAAGRPGARPGSSPVPWRGSPSAWPEPGSMRRRRTALRAEDVLCAEETVRHEAPCDRVEVRGLRRLAVAAAG